MKINKRKFGNVIIIVSCIMTIVMFGAFVAGFFIDKEPTATLGTLDYAIGNIGDDGEPIESNKAIYTKKVIMCESLDKVVKKSNATCSFEVHLYDKDGEYLGVASGTNYKTYGSGDTAVDVGGFRIVITPHQIDGEIPDIGILGISKYANMLEVTYTK